MSLFNQVSSSRHAVTTEAAIARSNIIGATGLPRAVLAAMFRRDGLFGRDSSLTLAEQAALQSRLPKIQGLAARQTATLPNTRLSAIAGFADARVAGERSEPQRLRLVREGLSNAAIAEIESVIDNVSVVFGNQPAAIEIGAAEAAPVYSKAA